MRFLKSLGFGLLLMHFVSCEKKIDFDLKESTPKLVVEATIENGEAPVVILTSTFDYFSTLSPRLLASTFVHNAVIRISDGNKTHTLKEYEIPVALDYKLYYYSTDSAALQTAITGALNHTYTLQIEKDGQQYTAQTTIPDTAKVVDSVWWKPAPPSEDSSRVVVMVKATDPQGYGDYVRYYTKINDGPFFPGLNSVYDDLFVDGTTYELQVEPGFDRNVKREEGDLFFHKGDVVTLKLSSIDRNTYEFWRTMEFSYASIGNPFATPIKVIGNISNGALGYFGGSASQYRTLVIPE
ncbi:MAG TPA: DUF4249 domain-containing protein [Chitinophagaceae bacterium]|nr:DUF4249 domain-containing protein [Chitinophagaceae bacterium]